MVFKCNSQIYLSSIFISFSASIIALLIFINIKFMMNLSVFFCSLIFIVTFFIVKNILELKVIIQDNYICIYDKSDKKLINIDDIFNIDIKYVDNFECRGKYMILRNYRRHLLCNICVDFFSSCDLDKMVNVIKECNKYIIINDYTR
ncbi:hypothetical protein OW763_07645 [Clostridium aestuarii]|uniref:Uncharacterized protein n=1 Tax=Clostridium aestuarii TaxID=338193 RepID=A0ABT4CZ23_9CLOT|nr:hypothetical protein [Clostridium aestuarii]MCY6484228.1 hypothetical protein [Clostridium aestuarii]